MSSASAAEVLKRYQVDGLPLMVIGTYEKGVTVYAQQVRALNLAWALVESDHSPGIVKGSSPLAKRATIAVVGGGFAGLTFVAALLKKNVPADIYVFEQRDTLLPLQHGSDTRWLHPQIYDWPSVGSDAQVAMLPVLNWTAARASDVVAQVLAEWKSTVTHSAETKVHLYCNTRHLQIDSIGVPDRFRIEWVGESRSADGTAALKTADDSNFGDTKTFDLVVLAVGFGLEKESAHSYWRNDVAGQPSLDASRGTYLISGQGDGAMIDLLRVRVSSYRQDRILDELFQDQTELVEELRMLQIASSGAGKNLFDELEALQSGPHGDQFREVIERLRNRLRRDTDAILHLRKRKLAALFGAPEVRISFQNKLLVYLLYKCGGFFPSTQDIEALAQVHRIEDRRILKRHGTKFEAQLEDILSEELRERLSNARKAAGGTFSPQPASIAWPGGFFGFAGKTRDAANLDEDVKAKWRKEYLPGATLLLASSFCAILGAHIVSATKPKLRLRVTLHRTMRAGSDELLQQCCEYAGANLDVTEQGAGRTFPVTMATIGLAYQTRKIVRSIKGVAPSVLAAAMSRRQLNEATRKMAKDVSFVAAIPLLEPSQAGKFTNPSPVVGVVYVDAMDGNFFLTDDRLETVVRLAAEWLQQLEKMPSVGRVKNFPYPVSKDDAKAPAAIPEEVSDALELVNGLSSPATKGPFQFNYDHSDFQPISGA